MGPESNATRAEPTTTASVVIPTHNEQGRIARTLRTLLRDAAADEFEIVVVCNGCTDHSAEVARTVDGVRVIELETASKIAALRAGDEGSDSFPRIYLDADVELSTEAARALVDALGQEGVLVAGLRGEYQLAGKPIGVQLYYEFRQRLGVFAQGIIGAGVYAMNADGRARFDQWPTVLGDDQFVFRLFDPHERALVAGHRTRVDPAPSLRAVIRRGIRVRRGNQQLTDASDQIATGGLRPPSAGVGEALRWALRSPRGLASLAVFMAVTAVIRTRARFGRARDWA